MCGIVGMVSSNTAGFYQSHKKIFSQMLWADTVRGSDGTGAFGVNKYGNIEYLKTRGHAGKLQESREYADFEDLIFSDFHMAIGHNRSATRGASNDENSHPFVENNTILVHNGTLTNHTDLTDQKVEVDSHAILHSIVERGYEATLKEIQGAFTLVWYSADDKTLRIIRNDQRPLFIASTVGAWFFASEKGMLEWILGRENVEIASMEECAPGTMYFFDLEDKGNMWYKPVELYKPKKLEIVKEKVDPKPPKNAIVLSDQRSGYTAADFPIGTRILINGENIQPLKEKSPDGWDSLIFGTWAQDPSIRIKCWSTEEEIDILEAAADADIEEDTFAFQAEIFCVMTKKGNVTLICRNTTPYVPRYDMMKNEIHEDEFVFTDCQCSYCNRVLSFDELEKGVFTFASSDDFLIECEHCLDKGMEKLI